MRTRILTRVGAFLAVAVSAMLAMTTDASAGLTPEQKCQKARYDAAGKYAQCQAKALGVLFAKNDLAKLQPPLSKCRVKYTATYLKLQKKALGTGSMCDAPRFVDTGNGTVTDNLTGLEWEKKLAIGPHDDDATFLFKGAYQGFLTQAGSGEGLNEVSSSTFQCFADNCDWRLPTVEELQTILSEPFPCATSPCIPAVVGPTVVNEDYWAGTSLADNADYAWGFFFGTGEVSYGLKTTANAVRVVRGGL